MEGLQPLTTTGAEKGEEAWREHQQGSWPPECPGGLGSGGGGRLGVGDLPVTGVQPKALRVVSQTSLNVAQPQNFLSVEIMC